MLKEWINPLYLNKNVILKFKKTLHNKKYVKIIQLKDFLKKDKIDLVFDDICNNKNKNLWLNRKNAVAKKDKNPYK